MISKRFDRKGEIRIPYLSAMSMLGRSVNEMGSYLEIADAIKQYGAYPKNDLEELWRRIIFNIMIANTDDHLRNHGFLYQMGKGWKLSPAFDLNPTPIEIHPRILSTMIDFYDAAGSLDLALSVANYFDLTHARAKAIIKEVGNAVETWQSVAKTFHIPGAEITQMRSAFDTSA